MSLSGMEQMAYIARQSDVLREHALEKDQRRTIRQKALNNEERRQLEKSHAVASMGENEKIDALRQDERKQDPQRSRDKLAEDSSFSAKSHYYNDPNLGGNIDISS
jgi:hypothetical protein